MVGNEAGQERAAGKRKTRRTRDQRIYQALVNTFLDIIRSTFSCFNLLWRRVNQSLHPEMVRDDESCTIIVPDIVSARLRTIRAQDGLSAAALEGRIVIQRHPGLPRRMQLSRLVEVGWQGQRHIDESVCGLGASAHAPTCFPRFRCYEDPGLWQPPIRLLAVVDVQNNMCARSPRASANTKRHVRTPNTSVKPGPGWQNRPHFGEVYKVCASLSVTLLKRKPQRRPKQCVVSASEARVLD